MEHLYYLVSQLPAFKAEDDSVAKLPITIEYYKDLCQRFMSEKNACIAASLSLEPPLDTVSTGSAFLDYWYNKERDLRFALAQLRALKMKKDAKDIPAVFDGEIVQVARTATGMDSPLSAEQYLNEYRLSVIDRITPLDSFSVDAVFSYGLRLMLTERMKKFTRDEGLASYHKIYEDILGENK